MNFLDVSVGTTYRGALSGTTSERLELVPPVESEQAAAVPVEADQVAAAAAVVDQVAAAAVVVDQVAATSVELE